MRSELRNHFGFPVGNVASPEQIKNMPSFPASMAFLLGAASDEIVAYENSLKIQYIEALQVKKEHEKEAEMLDWFGWPRWINNKWRLKKLAPYISVRRYKGSPYPFVVRLSMPDKGIVARLTK